MRASRWSIHGFEEVKVSKLTGVDLELLDITRILRQKLYQRHVYDWIGSCSGATGRSSEKKSCLVYGRHEEGMEGFHNASTVLPKLLLSTLLFMHC